MFDFTTMMEHPDHKVYTANPHENVRLFVTEGVYGDRQKVEFSFLAETHKVNVIIDHKGRISVNTRMRDE